MTLHITSLSVPPHPTPTTLMWYLVCGIGEDILVRLIYERPGLLPSPPLPAWTGAQIRDSGTATRSSGQAISLNYKSTGRRASLTGDWMTNGGTRRERPEK